MKKFSEYGVEMDIFRETCLAVAQVCGYGQKENQEAFYQDLIGTGDGVMLDSIRGILEELKQHSGIDMSIGYAAAEAMTWAHKSFCKKCEEMPDFVANHAKAFKDDYHVLLALPIAGWDAAQQYFPTVSDVFERLGVTVGEDIVQEKLREDVMSLMVCFDNLQDLVMATYRLPGEVQDLLQNRDFVYGEVTDCVMNKGCGQDQELMTRLAEYGITFDGSVREYDQEQEFSLE